MQNLWYTHSLMEKRKKEKKNGNGWIWYTSKLIIELKKKEHLSFGNRNTPPRGSSGWGDEVKGLVGACEWSPSTEERVDWTCGCGTSCAFKFGISSSSPMSNLQKWRYTR